MNAIADRLDSMDIPILDWFLSDGDEDGATKETGRYEPPSPNSTVYAHTRSCRPNDPLNADLSFKLFSRSDLAAMTGEKGGPVHLAVLGKVYDVSKGRKHYGPGGGYSFFAGEYAACWCVVCRSRRVTRIRNGRLFSGRSYRRREWIVEPGLSGTTRLVHIL
jgi:hypothetical protein